MRLYLIVGRGGCYTRSSFLSGWTQEQFIPYHIYFMPAGVMSDIYTFISFFPEIFFLAITLRPLKCVPRLGGVFSIANAWAASFRSACQYYEGTCASDTRVETCGWNTGSAEWWTSDVEIVLIVNYKDERLQSIICIPRTKNHYNVHDAFEHLCFVDKRAMLDLLSLLTLFQVSPGMLLAPFHVYFSTKK